MSNDFRIHVVFYRTHLGNEPVREWLKNLPREDKKIIGEDIKTVQFGWPLGMPLMMILLHGFIKKSQKTPKDDITLAKKRATDVRSRL